MMKKVIRMLMLLSVMMVASCSTDEDVRLVFIGDSLVARWDLEESFPSYVVENKGLSGSGIANIANYAHKYDGKNIVVIVGTNDLGKITDETMAEYAQNYMQQIVATDADMIYLFSILPRRFEGDSESINQRIEQLNVLIKTESENYGNVVYIDAYSRFMTDGDMVGQYSYDGLHLSPYGYEILSELLISNLK